jgi:hypothetical protein
MQLKIRHSRYAQNVFSPLSLDVTPLHAELFTADQLQRHGKVLAAAHVIGESSLPDQLLPRLADNADMLNDTRHLLTLAVQAKLPIEPAGEWLLDNFYLIEEQIRTAKQHLPKGYSQGLPRLSQGDACGLPRVYDLAVEAIAHSDWHLDAHSLSEFIAAYQSVQPLMLGELWAIPIMLRLVLIEHLSRIASRIATARIQRNQAQAWAARMIDTAENDSRNLILVIADMARSHPPMAAPFVAELARLLQGHGSALAVPLTWIEQRLAESSMTIEQMVLMETRQQATEQVSISNTIGSLRFLGVTDWRVFVESSSVVEQILRQDQVYCQMDFATRDRYRHVVEKLAKHSALSEWQVAQRAMELANQAQQHVGFYLIDDGLPLLKKAVAMRITLWMRARRVLRRFALGVYVTLIIGLSLGFAELLWTQFDVRPLATWQWLGLGVLSIIAASQLASSLVNWWATLAVKPKLLPRMDFSHGLPESMRTLVVIPSLISSLGQIDELVEALEVRYLGNRDAYLYFALLTDFHDADQARLPEDQALLDHLIQDIEQLNQKYTQDAQPAFTDRFFLLHRPRLWNVSEKVWMGYERKRGKLADLNAFLLNERGDDQQKRFSVVVGNLQSLLPIRYVITLDTDTQLPRDCARQLVSVMAHPLNHAHYDAEKKRITRGYGILQPSMAASLSGAQRSRYAQWCGTEPGIDPYTRSTSDVYQDVFAEGSFIGKGIYDVQAFEKVLKDRLPENKILSHDLLEGCYARSGLVSDLQLYEEYPPRYDSDVSRQQRWIRGDWQIMQWLLPRVPNVSGLANGGGKAVRNPLSWLSRWKIIDNLRRSMVPCALLLLLLSGWWLIGHPWLWTVSVVAVLLLPPLLIAVVDVLSWPKNVFLHHHLGNALRLAARSILLAGFRIACLPYEAQFTLSAIIRTCWRVGISHRCLLQWQVFSAKADPKKNSLLVAYRKMWIAPWLAISTFTVLLWFKPLALIAAIWILLLWLVAPAVVWWVSQPLLRRQAALSREQTLFLRKVARKTWRFFETFVNADENWLPPDNFQQAPDPVIAHRTSPTNIGLALLANVTAHDFGFIGIRTLLQRTQYTLQTLHKLERYRGHFYNWYDTQTLQPLLPRYISSVDSGNLAGHLVTLREALLALPTLSMMSPRLFLGLIDALPDNPADDLQDLLQQPLPSTLLELQQLLQTIIDMTQREHPDATEFLTQTQQAQHDLTFLLPELTDSVALRVDITLAELAQQPASLGMQRAAACIEQCQQLAQQANAFADMQYDFLYDATCHLLAVGFNVDDDRRDQSFYDLLASEARLANFVAIAQAQLPLQSWFALGRLLTTTDGHPVLVSWSGSMFEYLMPLLVMPSYDGSLLDQSCRTAVARQIQYGAQCGLPWGVSESGYNAVDISLNYRYQAFGVPGLGLKRGLAEDWVIAPYASALALMLAPEAACENLQRLAAMDMEGEYGFYEAIDYTPSRVTQNSKAQVSTVAAGVIVRSFMAHHHGMSLLAFAQVLLGQPMQQRFARAPEFQATLLLLQERIPKTSVLHTHVAEHAEGKSFCELPELSAYRPIGFDTANPHVQLLSNGRYHVMLTNAGGGYSRWQELAINRWREDSTCDNWGAFLYVRDVDTHQLWSTTYQPTCTTPDSYAAVFSEGRAEFRRRDFEIESYCEIVVSPEDDIELRRTHFTNRGSTRRTLELTSYAEVVLTSQAADMTQPSFASLFVQTQIIEQRRAIMATRRPRSAGEVVPWMLHVLAAHATPVHDISYETDRLRFIGRGKTLMQPQALIANTALSGSAGSVLDPIVAIRCCITLEPGQSASIDWITGAADSREACVALIEKYQDQHFANRVFDLAGTHSSVLLRQINALESDAGLYRRLAASVLYNNASLRAEAAIIAQNQRGQSGLWGYAISGDLPIVLLKIADGDNIELARQLIQCHAYWRLKGLAVDLVIWNEDHAGYRQRLQEQILALIAQGTEANAMDRPGGIFVRAAEQMSMEDRVLMQGVARVVLSDDRGSLLEQVNRRRLLEKRVSLLTPLSHKKNLQPAAPFTSLLTSPLMLSNAYGGFSADGKEYVITTTATQLTPLPWVNILANPHFGCVISESGAAYTWSENAHEFRLTPWSSDQVGAASGEAIYLRDEDSGIFWSATPRPVPSAQPYQTRHGFGYSVFEHTEQGIETQLWVYVDLQASVKFSVLKVRNVSGQRRRLSATGYVEWVLAELRSKSALHIITEMDSESGALLARNAYNTEFAGRVAFFDVDDAARTVTGDRSEFIGRNGSLQQPQAMLQSQLSGRLGAALDACGALQVPFELADGQTREIIFRLGTGHDVKQARALARRLRQPGSARAALEKVQQYWQRTLSVITIDTPDASLNVLTNGWLLYQTLACRLWARSGFYQSGGAFGFRDQLQDGMALVHADPKIVREHLLRAAQRQYPQGDVQHWWHPPAGNGVRTRCSDDYLWLPLATCRYVLSTGDVSVLDEVMPFLQGRLLNPEEESYYERPQISQEQSSLYQHCVLAIQHGLRFGEHGLPLMGSGDWNDGMNLVGIHGKGESIWLGFFLYEVLQAFVKLAQFKNDAAFAQVCTQQAQQLRNNIEAHGWDGAWYRRAYFDDGTALGSAANNECVIDSISQSWSVLSGAGDHERTQLAMDALDLRLVRRDDGLVQLLDPPFDQAAMNPGYIKGYVPGVRENGGQYTHAAVWAAMAFAAQGDRKRAWEVLSLINPIRHGVEQADIYKVEPYVLAADVYAIAPHIGRGGWTWYTGSASWLYRCITESVLGFKREGDYLSIHPCIPEHWPSFTLDYRHGETLYKIRVIQQKDDPAIRITLDDVLQTEARVLLVDDGQRHEVVCQLPIN